MLLWDNREDTLDRIIHAFGEDGSDDEADEDDEDEDQMS
jgi:hypothetical protein